MHELAVTESILEIALRHARQAEATHISTVYIVAGQLSSIVDDSVQFYWDFVAQGTPAEGAKLVFRRIPAELLCLNCGHTFGLNGESFSCPQCDSPQIKITAGEEFFLEALDIEK